MIALASAPALAPLNIHDTVTLIVLFVTAITTIVGAIYGVKNNVSIAVLHHTVNAQLDRYKAEVAEKEKSLRETAVAMAKLGAEKEAAELVAAAMRENVAVLAAINRAADEVARAHAERVTELQRQISALALQIPAGPAMIPNAPPESEP